MQDRYVGDIGDFAKFGLLRGLVCTQAAIRLGILWYAVPDEDHNNDGRHIGYLNNDDRFRRCDPELYDRLGRIVNKGARTLQAIEAGRILPSSTLYYSAPLTYDAIPFAQRAEHRKAWLTGGLKAVKSAGIVFADPDNGLETAGVGRFADKGPKFAFYDDFIPLAAEGKSLIIYQHACRRGSFSEQIRSRVKELRHHLAPHTTQFAVVRFRRVSARAFIFALADRHAAELRHRLQTFLDGAWGAHFEMADCEPD